MQIAFALPRAWCSRQGMNSARLENCRLLDSIQFSYGAGKSADVRPLKRSKMSPSHSCVAKSNSPSPPNSASQCLARSPHPPCRGSGSPRSQRLIVSASGSRHGRISDFIGLTVRLFWMVLPADACGDGPLGPPPFSSINSTPAASKARRTARSLAVVMDVSPSASSARRIAVAAVSSMRKEREKLYWNAGRPSGPYVFSRR